MCDNLSLIILTLDPLVIHVARAQSEKTLTFFFDVVVIGNHPKWMAVHFRHVWHWQFRQQSTSKHMLQL